MPCFEKAGMAMSSLHVVGLHEPPRKTPRSSEEGSGIAGSVVIRVFKLMIV
jgi:hypothetical protein